VQTAVSWSYGKHRSLEIGLALATKPDLVMLDQHVAGISQEETRSTIELIRSLTENKTMVIIENDMDVVFSLADRITVLHHGEITTCGPPKRNRGAARSKRDGKKHDL